MTTVFACGRYSGSFAYEWKIELVVIARYSLFLLDS